MSTAQEKADAKEAAASKKAHHTGLMGYLCTLTPAELAKLCSFFDLPSGPGLLNADGTVSSASSGHGKMVSGLAALEDAYAKHGDKTLDVISDFTEVLSGNYKPPVETK